MIPDHVQLALCPGHQFMQVSGLARDSRWETARPKVSTGIKALRVSPDERIPETASQAEETLLQAPTVGQKPRLP